MAKAASKPASPIDAYISQAPLEHRPALEQLRRMIAAAATRAEESTSYGLPAFRLSGKPLVAFGAAKKHIALYPMSGTTIAAHKNALKSYDVSKGAIRFTDGKLPPAKLIKLLIAARVAEIEESQTKGRKTAKKPALKKPSTRRPASKPAIPRTDVKTVLAKLESLATPRIRNEMGPRYGIQTKKAFGIAVGTLQKLAKEIGKNHDLALDLWKTGWYEARMLAAFIDEIEEVTPLQMDSWCNDFDNWGICDTVCFKLFDQSPHAFEKIPKWCKRKEEFVRRGGFALMACVALHNKDAAEEKFATCFPLIEAAADDDRNFVKKSVNWALRSLGHVHSHSIKLAALALAKKLAASENVTARWIGKDAAKSLEKVSKKNPAKK
jgi:3-methyladenine DNA glycosylase AlkD/uncharacterized protein YdhG (YjbR/CyaY superfamily)